MVENGNREFGEIKARLAAAEEDIRFNQKWRHEVYANQMTVITNRLWVVERELAAKGGATHILIMIGSTILSIAAIAVAWLK